MKTIPIVVFKVQPNGTPETTVTLLQQCLKVPPQGGFDFATIRSRSRVDAALEKAKGEISLEDADHATAVEAIKTTRWATNEAFLIQFAEQWGL